ncbi:MAG: tRNA lysidine(34) synthetase TilS [Xanthomonadales bacterium]|nr:tRNA lysidine(34) synthetase TilS [Xanthomonadales bacterium]
MAIDPSDLLARGLADLPEGPLRVGFSGGLDSTVLLHALAALPAARRRGLAAIHVDHGLHPASSGWAAHCARVCADLDVALHTRKMTVVEAGRGLEAAAREARWQAFRDDCEEGAVLVLGHHLDDQAETVLLRLLHGAGATGLSAMAGWRDGGSDGLRVWRPWLGDEPAGRPGIDRQTLAAWATARGLSWVEDPGNLSPRFERNHLREVVMPALRQRWPDAAAALSRSARRLADARDLERATGADLLERARGPDPRVLAWPALAGAPRPARWAALRLWLSALDIHDIGADRLARVERELAGAAVDASPRLVLPGAVLRRYRQYLYLLPPGGDQPLDYAIDWDGRQPLELPCGQLLLDPQPATALAMQVRSRRGGEAFRLTPGGPTRPLRLVLQEQAVPPWQRARWPVLWLDGTAAGFADLVASAALSARLAQSGSVLRFEPIDRMPERV